MAISHPAPALSTDVRVLLARAGYLEGEGGDLAEALRRLQRDRGLPVTGELDPATAAWLDRPACGTPARGGTSLFVKVPTAWPTRALTYAYVDPANGPGSSPSPRPPAVTQTLSVADARSAVRSALDTWEAQEGVDPDTGETHNLGLRFTEVAPDADPAPNMLIAWRPFPCEHKDDEDVYGAHADFPPGSSQYVDEWAGERLPIDFNDDVQVFTRTNVEYFMLHEVGHILGLKHSDVLTALMAEKPVENYHALQPDDEDGIRALYPPQGPERYNAIWAVGTVDRRAVFSLPGDEVEAERDRQLEDGYKLMRLHAFYKPNAGLRYNAIFEVYGGDRIRVQNRTRESFDERAAELKAQGWGPISLSAVVMPDGESRWNAVYTRDDAARSAVWGETREDLEAIIAANRAQQHGLFELNAYLTADGEERFNAVFWTRERDTRHLLRVTRAELNDRIDELNEEGYATCDVTGYALPNGGGDRWNAVVEKASSFDQRYRTNRLRYDLRARLDEEEEREGRRAWVLNAFVPQTAATTTTGGTTTIPHIEPVPAGQRAVTLGLALDGGRAYVTRYLEQAQPPHATEARGVLEAIDRATAQVVATGEVGFRPRAVAVNPVTRRIYVVNLDPRTYTVTVLDADSLTEVATIAVGQGPTAVAVNLNLNRIYVSNWFGRRVQVIDGATNTLLPQIDTGPGPQGIAVDPATNRLYVALSNRSFQPFVNGLAVYSDDGTTVTAGPRVDIGGLGHQSVGVAVDPTADRVYVANLGGGGIQPSVTALRKSTLEHVATVNVPGPCRALACNGDAGELYVAGDRGLQVLDTPSLKVRRTIAAGRQPFNVACDEGDGRQVWVGGPGQEAVRVA
jgi:DNA-binding beta-propeller fold protein YncE